MKIKMKIEKEVDIKTLRVSAGVRFWEDATLQGLCNAEATMPFRDGDCWAPSIDIDSGVIIGWPQGVIADIHYKVCDQFCFNVIDEDNNIIIEVNDVYVPSTMAPGVNGYGDYIIMRIDGNGKIEGWNFKIEDFIQSE